MKKTKTSAALSHSSVDHSHLLQDQQISMLQSQSKDADIKNLTRKNQLLKQQLQIVKQSKQKMSQQMAAYRRVLFSNADIHEVLELQHQKIFDLSTTLEVLQAKYNKLLSNSGSSQQTHYAIKCQQLENRLKQREIEHQKQISILKTKMMKMNANELYSNNTGMNMSENMMSPLRNNKKLV